MLRRLCSLGGRLIGRRRGGALADDLGLWRRRRGRGAVFFLGRGFGMYVKSPRLLLLGVIPALISTLLVVAGLLLVIVFIGDIAAWVTWFANDWPAEPLK